MAELNVSRKNIRGLLSLSEPSTRGKHYVIPEYQRPYRWEIETCETLWNDLKNFFTEHENDGREYFLGSIVTCGDNENQNEINIIDGQQRITSFMLLLRAFYRKLEKQLKETPNNKSVEGLMRQIGPCIWHTDAKTEEVVDMAEINLKTFVATNDDEKIFADILRTGEVEGKPTSYYEKNYKFFQDCCEEFSASHFAGWLDFLLFILDRCIVLPIECTDLDSALTIFGTLNDRGLPLADSDIFKAELYKLQPSANKQAFSEEWKELEQNMGSVGLNLDALFRYNMYVDRASRGGKEKEKGLRVYYSGEGNKYNIFKEDNFFKNLKELGEFWVSICSFEEKYCDEEGLKYIQCLMAYPNEYWRYPISVFYHINKRLSEDEFKNKLTPYLRKLLSFVFVRFIEAPTVNQVKPYIFSICHDTYIGKEIDFPSYQISDDFLTKINSFSPSKMSKPLLMLNTYLFDDTQPLILGKADIEHIFPRSWQNTNYNGWNKNDAETHLDMFGNKIIFEKKLNIQAGNGYFDKKKDKYKESNIKEVQHLGSLKQSDWLKEDIERRNEEILNRLYSFFLSNLQQQTETNILMLKLIHGDEVFCVYKVVDGSKNIVRYKIDRHVYDLGIYDIVNKKMIDKTDFYNTIQEALRSIEKNEFIYSKLEIVDDSINVELDTYLKS